MKVVLRGSHHEELGAGEGRINGQFGANPFFSSKKLVVLVQGELIVAEFLVQFVVAPVVKAAKHHAEENAHVRVVVKWHSCTLLDEEKHKSVIFAALYRYSVQILLEMVGVIWPLHSDLLQRYLIHALHELLATWFMIGVVKEIYAVAVNFRFDAHFLYGVDQ